MQEERKKIIKRAVQEKIIEIAVQDKRLDQLKAIVDEIDDQMRQLSTRRNICLEEKTIILNEIKMELQSQRKSKNTHNNQDLSFYWSDTDIDTENDDDDDALDKDDNQDIIDDSFDITDNRPKMKKEQEEDIGGESSHKNQEQLQNTQLNNEDKRCKRNRNQTQAKVQRHNFSIQQRGNKVNKNRGPYFKSTDDKEYLCFVKKTQDYLSNFEGHKKYPIELKEDLLYFAKYYGMKKISKDTGVPYTNIKTWRRKKIDA